MAKKKKKKVIEEVPAVELPEFPHRFRCKSCGAEYENADTNAPDCPVCKGKNCAERTG